MSISASLYKISPISKKEYIYLSKEYNFPNEFIINKNYFGGDIFVKNSGANILNNFKTNYLKCEEIYYIDDSSCFKKKVLENYEINLGFFKFKNGYKYLKKKCRKKMLKKLKNELKIKFIKKYLKDNNFFIDLGY